MKIQSRVNNRSGICAAAFLATALVGMPNGTSAETLDQSVDPDYSIVFGIGSPGAPFELDTAQTFTVGISGLLSRVEVSAPIGGPVTTFDWDIRALSAAQSPLDDDNAALARGSVTWSEELPSDFISLDLSQTPIPVIVGQKLAIVLSSPSGSFGWYGSTISDYSGGEAWQRSETLNNGFAWIETSPGSDLGFRTFVTVPEPNSVALIALGTASLTGWRRRRGFRW